MPGLPGATGTGSASAGSGDILAGSAGGNGTLGGDDPFGGLGREGGVMTAAERRAVLDARLESSYGTFDGMIIGERQRSVADANAAGSSVMGTGAGEGGEGEGGGQEGGEGAFGEGATVMASANTGGSGGNGTMPDGGLVREGEYSNQNKPTFAPPGDIPSGDDDDVVARQLREAALHEPDPVLREKLWDEYRQYTGLSTQ